MATKQPTKAKQPTKMSNYHVVVPFHEMEFFNLKAKNKKEAKEGAIKEAQQIFRQSNIGLSAIAKGKVVVTKK